ncbi:MAG: hypothetical protein U0Q12_06840 [Vicinamibacterales bacterium]
MALSQVVERAERVGLPQPALHDLLTPVQALLAASPRWTDTFGAGDDARAEPAGHGPRWWRLERLAADVEAHASPLGRAIEATTFVTGLRALYEARLDGARARLDHLVRRGAPNARVLALGGGGCHALSLFAPDLAGRGVSAVVVDDRRDVLERGVSLLRERAVPTDAIAAPPSRVGSWLRAQGLFDLVLATDICDAASDAQLEWLLPKLVLSLTPRGWLAMSAITHPNPLRVPMTYFARWRALERTTEGLSMLLRRAHLGRLTVQIDHALGTPLVAFALHRS